MPLLQLRDVRIYYEVHGTGQPLLMLLGLPAVVSDVLSLVSMLAKNFTVVVCDNRGSGESGKPEGRYSIKLFAQDAAGLLDGLHIEKAHVFGFSMGGMIAEELALSFPGKVDRLVLG